MTKHVFIADPDADSRVIFRTLLEYHQFRVTTTGAGDGILRILAEDPPDLVIVDYPYHLGDGRRLIPALRAHPELKEIPILAATSRSEPEHRRAAREAGCDDVCVKPIDPRALAAQVRRMLGPSLDA